MSSSDFYHILRQNLQFSDAQRRRADLLSLGILRDVAREAVRRGYTPADSRIIYSDALSDAAAFAEFCREYCKIGGSTTPLGEVFFSGTAADYPVLTIPDMPPLRLASDVLAQNGFIFDVVYSDSFADAVYEVQVGSGDFTLLPAKQRGERLTSFDAMRRRAGLKINAVVIDASEGSEFSLVSGTFSDIAKISEFTRLAFTAECQGEPYELLSGAKALGASPTEVYITGRNLCAELDISKISDITHITALVSYIAAYADAVFDGIYTEYK